MRLTLQSSNEIRRKKFRTTELARYCFGEAAEAIAGYVTTSEEHEAFEHYEGLLKDKELVRAKDDQTNGTLKLAIVNKKTESIP